MAKTGAERARDYRARKKRREAAEQQTGALAAPVEPEAVTVTSRRDGVTLDAAGQRLWDELDGDTARAGRRALVLEACRIADRLGQLDAILRGDAEDWLRIVQDRGNPERQELVINAPLAEARQQATALKQIIGELRQSRAEGGPARPKASGDSQGGGGVPAGVTSLADRIAAKRGSTSAG